MPSVLTVTVPLSTSAITVTVNGSPFGSLSLIVTSPLSVPFAVVIKVSLTAIGAMLVSGITVIIAVPFAHNIGVPSSQIW